MDSILYIVSYTRESEGEFRYGNYWEDVEDLRSVICYLKSVGHNVNILVGHSRGMY